MITVEIGSVPRSWGTCSTPPSRSTDVMISKARDRFCAAVRVPEATALWQLWLPDSSGILEKCGSELLQVTCMGFGLSGELAGEVGTPHPTSMIGSVALEALCGLPVFLFHGNPSAGT